MSAVWRRPSLTLLEVLWRWAAGVPLLLLLSWQARRLWPSIPLDTAALADMTVFRPLESFRTLRLGYAGVEPILAPVARWLVPLVLAIWALAWSIGRGVVLWKLGRTPRERFAFSLLLHVLLLRLLRTAMLFVLAGGWWGLVKWAATFTVSGPGSRGEEPRLVLFCAFVICGSLLMFVGWGAVNWVVDAAPLLAIRYRLGAAASLAATLKLGAARGKLIEINLVMGIVKIALLVLALVFSACPLPFEGVATQDFLTNWWIGVAVLYFLASDYFHVVRSAAYLELFREGSNEIFAAHAPGGL